MPCVLTTSFLEECSDSLGGIQAGEFLVGRLDEVTASIVVAGEVTSITGWNFLSLLDEERNG